MCTSAPLPYIYIYTGWPKKFGTVDFVTYYLKYDKGYEFQIDTA